MKNSRAFVKKTEWLLTACLVAFFVAFLPVFLVYLPQLWAREYYRFFPFAFATTIYLALVRASRRPIAEASVFRWTIRVIALGIAQGTLIFGIVRGSVWPCYFASIVTLGLILDFWNEANSKRSLLYLLLPVALTIRLPMQLDLTAVQELQSVTSRITSDLLFAVRVDHLLAGNIIQPMSGEALLVDEACSGVQSLFTLMFIAAFLGTYQRYTLPRTSLLVGSAVFWALVMNVFRVFTIAIAQTQFHVDLATGWKHELVGYAGILVAIFFLLSSDRFVLFFLSGVPDDARLFPHVNIFVAAWNWCFVAPEINNEAIESMDRSTAIGASLISSRNASPAKRSMYPAWIFSVMLGVLLASSLPAWALLRSTFSNTTVDAKIAVDLPVNTSWLSLGEFPNCSLLQFETERRENSAFGERSELWTVATPVGNVRHSIDHPFFGFHDLTICYRNIGWQMLKVEYRDLSVDDKSWPVVMGEFLRPTGERAIVLFSSFGLDGTSVAPVAEKDNLTLLNRRLQGVKESSEQSVQVQTLFQSIAPVSETVISELLQSHGKVRIQLKDRVVGHVAESANQKEP